MRRQDFYLEKYDWQVTVLYEVTCFDEKKVISILNLFEPTESLIIEVKGLIDLCNKDTGFTYTNYNNKSSLILIGECSSPEELLNSITHENMHLAIHISEYYNFDLTSEEPCYLIGEIAQNEYNIVRSLL